MADFELTNTIKIERAKMNMTQEELAFKIGVSRKTINTIETGKFVPSTITALRIAYAFNMKVDDLFTIETK